MVKKLVFRKELAAICGVSAPAVTKACSSFPPDALVGKKVDLNHSSVVKYVNSQALKKPPEPEAVATGLDPMYEEAVRVCTEAGRWSTSYLQRKLRIGYNRAAKLKEVLEVNGLVPEGGTSEPKAVPPPPNTVHQVTFSQEHIPKDAPETASAEEMAVPEDLREYMDWSLRDLMRKFGTHTSFSVYLKAVKEIEMIQEKRLKNATTEGTLVSRQLVDLVLDVFDSAHLRLLRDGAKTLTAGVVSKRSSGASLPEIEGYVSDILGSFITPAKDKSRRAMGDGSN